MRILDYLKRNKNILPASVAILFSALVFATLYVLCNIDGVPVSRENSIKFIVLSAAVVLFLSAIIVIAKLKLLKTEGLVAIILAFFCIVCMAVFPPFTVPDEYAHYRSVYHMSNIVMFDFSDEQGKLNMRQCDYEYLAVNNVSLYDQGYVSEKGYDKIFADDAQVIKAPAEYMNKPLPHIVPGIGLAIARLLGLGAYWGVQLARLFNAAMCIVFLFFAIKIIPYGKLAIAAISLLPMNLHIIASCSYDAFTFGGVMLIFAYIVNMMHTDKKIGWKQLLILAIMIAFVVPQKVVYIAVAALVLLVEKEQFEKPKLHFLFKCCLGILAVGSVFAFQFSNTERLVASTVEYSGEAGYSIPYILSNPLQMTKMLFRTIVIQGDFYIKSLISYFGWFEMETPWFLAVPYVAILALSFMRKKDEPAALGWLQKSYSLAMFIVCFLLIELLLLIDHTPMGSEIVLGVQGRYFIPALPALFLFFRNNSIELSKSCDKYLLFVISLLNSGVFIYSLSYMI